MKTKNAEEDWDDDNEIETIEEWESKRLPFWVKIIIWFVIFILVSWSIAWFY